LPLAVPVTDACSAKTGTAPVICPVTHPNASAPLGKKPGRPSDYGNGKLWTTLWPDGKVLVAPPKGGYLRMKFPWWRGVRGPLTISGRRLDAPAPPLKADVSAAYGETGFQPSELLFPSEGCWEITGRAGDAELTFVTEVRIKR
jgi:hypothetical protein